MNMPPGLFSLNFFQTKLQKIVIDVKFYIVTIVEQQIFWT